MTTHASRTALIPVAGGSEPLETVTIADVLHRGGFKVTLGSCADDLKIKTSTGLVIMADIMMSEAVKNSYDVIALPGGAEGTKTVASCENSNKLLKAHIKDKKIVGAICAAPVNILIKNNFFTDRRMTSYPAMMDFIPYDRRIDERLVVDDNLITSQGPGTSIEFALAIIHKFDPKKAIQVHRDLVACPKFLPK